MAAHCKLGAIDVLCSAWAMPTLPPVSVRRLGMQLVRKLGGDDAPFEGLKLHRPATSYTSHPLWADLTGPHCSFEEACSLLAGGAAEDLLAAPAACRALRHKRAPADAAIVGQQLEKERRSKLQRQEQPADAAQSSCAQCGAVNAAAGQQGLCGACSRAVPGQPAAAAAAAAVQRSGGGGGDTAADGQQNAAAPAAGQKFRQTTWSGLEPSDCGTYSVRLPRSVWDGKCGIISAPGEQLKPCDGPPLSFWRQHCLPMHAMRLASSHVVEVHCCSLACLQHATPRLSLEARLVR